MARIRSLNPSFWTDDKVAGLPFPGRLLFQGLWTYADDAGRLKDNPRQLKAQVFPYDNIPFADIDAWLDAISDSGMIVRYKINGQAFIQITNFKIYQKPDHPMPSKIPPPPEGSSSALLTVTSKSAAVDNPQTLIEPSPNTQRVVGEISPKDCRTLCEGIGVGVGGGDGKEKGRGNGKGLGTGVGIVGQPEQASAVELHSLKILKGIKNWPFDPVNDLAFIRELATEFSCVDIDAELPDFAAYQMDHPIGQKDSPRLKLRRWVEKAAEFAKKRSQYGAKKEWRTEKHRGDPLAASRQRGVTVIDSGPSPGFGEGAERDTN